MPKPRIFLSLVSSEFAELRQRLASYLRRSNCDVEYQESFENASEDVIEKLSNKIYHPNDGPCDLVVHVAGNEVGATSNPKAVAGFFKSLPDEDLFLQDKDHAEIKTLLTSITRKDAGSEITYTQWEAYLAFHHGVPIIVYAPEDAYAEPTASTSKRTVRDDFPQKEHLQRLYSVRKHHDTYTDSTDLLAKIMADVPAHMRKHLPSDRLPVAFKPKPNNLPLSIGSLFKGRDEFLKSVGEKLQSGAAAITPDNLAEIQKTKPTAVYGSGGIGKTRTAVEYGWQNESNYTGLLFVNAESPEMLITSLGNLYCVLEINEVADASDEIRLQHVLDWMKRHPGWLAILDNVDTPEAATAVRKILGSLTNGHVVITSRIASWSGVVEQLDLGVLSVDSAVDYLLEATHRRTKTDNDSNMAEKVALQVGQLALGLEHAKGYINQFGISFADYLKEWEEDEAQILNEFPLGEIEYPRELLVTWKLSVDSLEEDSRRLLFILAWFAPEPIPETALEKLPDDFLPGGYRKGLASLVDICLVSRDQELDAESLEPVRSFKLHRLVQATTRYHLCSADSSQNDGDGIQLSSLERALQTIDDSFFGDPTDVRSWPVLEPLAEHAQSIVDFAVANSLVSSNHPTSRLLNELGVLFKQKSRFQLAEENYRRSLEIDQNSFGSDHPNVATDLNNLAQLLKATNRLSEAEPLMRQALQIDQNAFDSDHPKIAIRLNNLAQLLQATNRLLEAEPLMRQALQIDQNAFGSDHPNVAIRLNNLALLLQATNRLSEAEPLMRQALQIDQNSFGSDHPKIAIRLNNLAQLLQATNRLSEAEPLMRQALQIDQNSFGSDHPKIAIRLNNLAQLLQAAHRLSEAEPLMRQALQIDQNAFGSDHPKVALKAWVLATILSELEQYAEAADLMRQAIRIYHLFKLQNLIEHPHWSNALGMVSIDTGIVRMFCR